jgi:hypothetical protein
LLVCGIDGLVGRTVDMRAPHDFRAASDQAHGFRIVFAIGSALAATRFLIGRRKEQQRSLTLIPPFWQNELEFIN